MKAVLLAAGASTRLYPLTLEKPKALLPMGDGTILDQQITGLINAGIDELVIVVGYHKELIRAHLAEKAYPLSITYVDNDDYQATGPIFGGLANVLDHFREPVVFLHCDVLFESRALRALIKDPRESVMLYREGAWDEEAGKIIVDTETGRVHECGKHIEQARASGEYLQIAKFGSAFGEALIAVVEGRKEESRDGFTIDAFNEVLRGTDCEVFGLPFSGLALEIDTPEDYEAAKAAWNTRV